MSSSLPIGIFDSGIGGLTVADAIHRQLPGEQLLYFGDTTHLPYGDKAPSSIREYSKRIAQFLLDKDCKALVIACNTASSLAFDEVKEAAGDIPVINVIDPVVDALGSLENLQKVGVIGTKGTIGSGAYENRILAQLPEVEVSSLATPLLVPMIEEGFIDNTISQTILANYLNDQQLTGINALILGCTHYPLIKTAIEHFFHGDVVILDSAEIVGSHVNRLLNESGLTNTSGLRALNHHFYVSDFTPSFEDSTRFFFKEEIHLEEYDLWGSKPGGV